MKKKILLAAAFLLILMGCSSIINSENKIEDGNYSCNVTLEGGSGKATVDSPADVVVEDGEILVTLVWSSTHYDYMLVDDVKYENEDHFPIRGTTLSLSGLSIKGQIMMPIAKTEEEKETAKKWICE